MARIWLAPLTQWSTTITGPQDLWVTPAKVGLRDGQERAGRKESTKHHVTQGHNGLMSTKTRKRGSPAIISYTWWASFIKDLSFQNWDGAGNTDRPWARPQILLNKNEKQLIWTRLVGIRKIPNVNFVEYKQEKIFFALLLLYLKWSWYENAWLSK